MTGSSPSALFALARRQAGRVKRALLPARAGPAAAPVPQGEFDGHVEGMQHDGTLRGWVHHRASGKGRVPVGLHLADDTLLVSGYADISRGDVQDANGCERECGFSFAVTDAMFSTITDNGGLITVRTTDVTRQTLGKVDIVVDPSDPEPRDDTLGACVQALRGELETLLDLLHEVPRDLREGRAPLPPIVQPPFEPHARMFSTEPLIPDVPASGHPAYLDYVRYRYRMDDDYRVAPGLEAADRFLYWYLVSYRSRERLRVPLSAGLVDYLNAPIVMGGQQYALSRAMWWRMTGRPDMMGSVNLNDRDGYLNTLFWWAHQDSTHMYFEDCLIPDRYADFLRGVHPSRRTDAYPLSYFTERFFLDSPRLHFLDPGSAEGRKTLALSMMVIAAERPDLLRYIPRGILGRLLSPGKNGGPSSFETFVNELGRRLPEIEIGSDDDADDRDAGEGAAKAGADDGPAEADTARKAAPVAGTDADAAATASATVPGTDASDANDANDGRTDLSAFETPGRDDDARTRPRRPVAISRDAYVAALRRRGFDLDSYGFMTRDRHGNRFEAAALPPVDPDIRRVDVQLVGPLAKASGLGQATRLSASILRATGIDVRGVDFGLDNPAPEGFSSDTMIEEYGPAEINIIHLNAESIPLAFAYQPDVFSGAYNIGYFFWELDKPAYCHYLGMEMLDEIWVSTEYGVQIYSRDDHGKPVVNVGMCYEDTPGITREDSRAFVERRFRLDARHFVCLVAFDSFSFVQRKNPVSVLRAFQKAFEGVPDARLVVKTQNRDSVFDTVQVNLWDQVDTIIASDPRIVVMNETLSYRDLLKLKAGSDVYVSLHKSEGWGFGMIEAMNLGVPVVCTGYSGNMDFCTPETAWLVDHDEVLLQKEDYIFVRRGSVWAEPCVDSAATQLRAAYDDPDARNARARAAQDHIRTNFSTNAIAHRYGNRLRTILKKRQEK